MKLHWYLCMEQKKPPSDKVVNDRHGFVREPDYEIIEAYDLRKVGYETFKELIERNF